MSIGAPAREHGAPNRVSAFAIAALTAADGDGSIGDVTAATPNASDPSVARCSGFQRARRAHPERRLQPPSATCAARVAGGRPPRPPRRGSALDRCSGSAFEGVAGGVRPVGVGGGLYAAPSIPHALDGDQRDPDQYWSQSEQ
jgi:hypothetical protein